MLTDVGGTPVVQSSSGGFGGEGGWLGMLLVIALLGGGNGFGFGGGNAAAQGLTNDFLYSSLNNNMQQGFSNLQGQNQFSDLLQGQTTTNNALIQGFAGLNTQISNGMYNTLLGQKDLISNMDSCCCTTNRNIDAVRFDNAQNTCAIIQNASSNTQRIIDWLSCNEIKELNAKIAEQGQALSEARIIGAMKPQAPIPAYTVQSPYAPFNGCGFSNCAMV